MNLIPAITQLALFFLLLAPRSLPKALYPPARPPKDRLSLVRGGGVDRGGGGVWGFALSLSLIPPTPFSCGERRCKGAAAASEKSLQQQQQQQHFP